MHFCPSQILITALTALGAWFQDNVRIVTFENNAFLFFILDPENYNRYL
jgi:hypothetical protein